MQVRARHEKVVALAVRCKGFVAFLPTYEHQHRSCGHWRTADLPLFPGYVLCRFDPQKRLPILTIPGVFSIVSTGKAPAPLEEREVLAIQNVIEHGLRASPIAYLEAGDRVRMVGGPLLGVEGLYQGQNEKHRLIISVTLLQRSIVVEVDPKWVCAAEPEHPVERALRQAREMDGGRMAGRPAGL
ncbi:MAG: NusG-like protein [Acidobacteria bacterium]|nr:NusG-like protein [Acidobacteriota bacterium]